ncbi:uncharacterized protein B0H18DRAFT_1126005 [Fomitopsis serialis]|uniref:uncharacterized protein n=1 Tax=Fomitopsis serialis TaxID=139415 RepID=UPI0020079B03|nr:uncharacterized protein B0H18DRAFT_1126005 [Neoantrodia serialis]KAH9913766.1 hypothetical protein B0H18DRAFT_1126005 [Neoantrodia serialis]
MSNNQDNGNSDLMLLSNEVVRVLASESKRLRDKVAILEAENESLKTKTRDAEDRGDGLAVKYDELKASSNKTEGEIIRLQKQLLDTVESLRLTTEKLVEKKQMVLLAESRSYRVKDELDEASHQLLTERLEHSYKLQSLNAQLAGLKSEYREPIIPDGSATKELGPVSDPGPSSLGVNRNNDAGAAVVPTGASTVPASASVVPAGASVVPNGSRRRATPDVVVGMMSGTSIYRDPDHPVAKHFRERVLREEEFFVGCCGLERVDYDVRIERALVARSQKSALKRKSGEKHSQSQKKRK